VWCLYHLDGPRAAIAEARRVLEPDGVYFAATSGRDNDPEIMPEGYPGSTFDAEEAEDIVGVVFDSAVAERWDAQFFALETREEVRAYCRHDFIPLERADIAKVPLWLTMRGALVRARK